MKGVNPIFLNATWTDYYLQNWVLTPNPEQQTLMSLISIIILCSPSLDKNLKK